MKIGVVEEENMEELDRLINSCIQDRKICGIKLTPTDLPGQRIQHASLIMLGD